MTSPVVAGDTIQDSHSGSLRIPVWLRNPAGIAIIAAALFGILGILTVLIEIGQPFGYYASYGYLTHPEANISQDTPNWWPVIATGQVRYTDEILTINDLPYIPNARSELGRAYISGDPIRLVINRPGESKPVNISLPVQKFTFADFLDIKLPEILVGVAFWLLAVVVLRSRPDSETNRVFAAITSCVAIHRLTVVTSIVMDEQLLFNLPKIGHMLAAGLIGPLLFHLSFLFPKPLRHVPRKILVGLYVVGIMCGLTLAISRSSIVGWFSAETWEPFEHIVFLSMLFLLLGGILSLFWRLIWSLIHWREASRRERRVDQILLLGLLISLPPVIAVLSPIVPGIAGERPPFFMALDLRYFMLAIPIAFALAILRYQTFQSPSPLFLSVIVMSMSAIVAAIAVAIWMMAPTNDPVHHRPPFVLFFSAIFLSSIFWSRQTDWRGWFGRYLNRTDRNYESVRSFGNRVMGRTDLRVLPSIMAQALVDEMELERAAIWILDTNSMTYVLSAAAGGDEPPAVAGIQARGALPSRAFQVGWPDISNWLRAPAADGKFEVMVPLIAGGRPIGLLGLGSRWDEEIFDERDLSVAELVGQQATLFILAATQVEELRRVPGRVAEAQERERYRLASELHDTVQQFLGRLPFFLAVSRDLMATDRAESTRLINQCMDGVEDAARVLREIRANLAPNQLEVSLTKPMGGLVRHIQHQSRLIIELEMPDNLDESTNLGTRHALYRVIQQALDNIVTHAEATEVMITLQREDERVLFMVVDNGCGVDESAILSARAGGSFGLQSMRARIETVGGEFSFTSKVGQGTVVSGWVPVE